ncbi:MAG: hypothetical protein ACR2N4_06505, partial [Jatrophihabitans sp.]
TGGARGGNSSRGGNAGSGARSAGAAGRGGARRAGSDSSPKRAGSQRPAIMHTSSSSPRPATAAPRTGGAAAFSSRARTR